MKKRVLVFDSGVGGLSVYSEVKKHNPDIVSFYMFDNQLFPYGNKSEAEIINRVNKLMTSFVKRYQVDLIVIACNTASTIVLDDLRSNLSIPIVGVVPAIKPAVKITKNKIVGLLATPATVARKYTHGLIEDFAKDVKVLSIGTPNLASIAEKKMSGKDFSINEIAQELKPWLDLSINEQPDTIVLGCTHFPHLRTEIQNLFPNATLVDSGNAIGIRVNNLLKDSKSIEKTDIDTEQNEAFCTSLVKLDSNLENTFKKNGFDEILEFKI